MATIVGTIGKDFIHAAGDGIEPPAGYDEIVGVTGGPDTVSAGDGNDYILGAAGDDRLVGGLGNDGLFGDAGGDILYGGDGHDILRGGAGADRLDGGAGTDWIDYETSSAGVKIRLATGHAGGGDAAGDTLALIENVIGSDFDDLIVGDAGANDLTGRGGDDLLTGGAGDDDLELGAGHDRGLGGDGDDYIEGEDGDDALRGEIGDDYLRGELGNDDLAGGDGDDILGGGGGVDVILGGFGNDEIDGGENADLLRAGAGNDRIFGGGAKDKIYGEEGDDEILTSLWDIGSGELYDGGVGNDRLVASATISTAIDLSKCTLTGFETLWVEGAAARLSRAQLVQFGHVDADRILVADGGSLVIRSQATVSLGTTFLLHPTGNSLDLSQAMMTGVSVVGGAADDTVIGGIGDETVAGSAGDDVLNGGGGNDLMDGGRGADVLKGGAGIDVMDGGAGADSLDGGAGDDVLSLSGNDGPAAGDYYRGGEGNDHLTVRASSFIIAGATFNGGLGVDRLSFTDDPDLELLDLTGMTLVSVEHLVTGASTLTGASTVRLTADQLDQLQSTDARTVRLSTGGLADLRGFEGDAPREYFLSDDGNQLNLIGLREAAAVHGGAGADTVWAPSHNDNARGSTLEGNGGDDWLIGGADFDRLDGGKGNDRLQGGGEDDRYIVDSSADRIIELADGGSDDVESSATYVLGRHVESLRLVGTADIAGHGNELDNGITGNDGDNLISGGDGDDGITGGGGSDALYGGAGDDSVSISIRGGDLREDALYSGGAGFDTVAIGIYGDGGFANFAAVDSAALEGFERLMVLGSTVCATTSQLQSISDFEFLISSRSPLSVLRISGSGSLDLSDATSVQLYEILLSNKGNTLILTGQHGTYLSYPYGYIVRGGTAADTVLGGVSYDELFGGDGNDSLLGAEGADRLSGGRGADALEGGADADRFVFAEASTPVDTIADYHKAEGDRLEFDSLLHGSFAYRGAGGFTATGNSEARFDGGRLLVDFDGNGVVDITVNLVGITGAAQLTNADFLWT